MPSARHTSGVAQKRNVLLIDDHVEYRRRVCQLLEAEGHEVVAQAGDGAEGVRAAAEVDPDVILLDVHLPDALGFDLAAGLANTAPVILISTHDEESYRERAAASGAAGFVTKDALDAAAIEALLD